MKDRIEEIWKDLNEELYFFIRSKIKIEEDAKDILQEVFIKIQGNLHQLKKTSKLTSWTYQITRNTIIDHYRNKKNNFTFPESLELEEKDSEDFEYAKLTDCVNGKIKKLSKDYKEAIVLTYLKDFSQKQLAEYSELSYSGAKSRVQKARQILKNEILDCSNLESDNSGKIIDFQKN